jgi:phage terminase large subunit-like protein
MTRDEKIELLKYYQEIEYRRKANPLKYIDPLPYQREFMDEKKHRNLAVLGGNRSGKSLMSTLKMLRYLLENPGSKALMVTWSELSKRVQQPNVNELLPWGDVEYGVFNPKKGFTHKYIRLSNNSEIRFQSYEMGQAAFQGTNCDIIVLDEEPPQDVYNEALMRLVDRGGQMVRTLTPVSGMSYLYDEIIMNNTGAVKYWFWDSRNNKYINQAALIETVNRFTEKEREMRLTGAFVSLGEGMVYESYTDENMIEYDLFDPSYGVIYVACDFNVKMMSWSLIREENGIAYVFDNITREDSADTQSMCNMLKASYPNRIFEFFCDAAGGQRGSSTTLTDHAIIHSNFPNSKMFFRKPPHVKDRIAATNARLRNGNGIHMFVNKKNQILIRDFKNVTWDMLGHDPSKKQQKLTHASDGVSYYAYLRYPLHVESTKITVRQ